MNISVIIPVYNAEPFLRKAVASALQFNDVKEVILIEDNSPDKALEICKELVKEDKRVKLFQHPNNENRGAGPSRNLGMKHATQEYIAFLDADDFYLPNRFEKDKIVFEKHTDADGVYNAIGVHFYSEKAEKKFNKTFSNKDGSEFLTTVNKKVEPKDLFEVLLNMNGENIGYFSIDGFTIKKETLETLRNDWFKAELRVHQDTDFLWRLAYYGKLYAGNISTATAMRGVHEENRITANEKDIFKKIHNRYLMYSTLYQWAKKEKIPINYLIFLESKMVFTDVYKQPGAKMLFIYFKHAITRKGFLNSPIHQRTRNDMKRIINHKFKTIFS